MHTQRAPRRRARARRALSLFTSECLIKKYKPPRTLLFQLAVKRMLAQERVVLHQFHAPGRVPAVLCVKAKQTKQNVSARSKPSTRDIRIIDPSPRARPHRAHHRIARTHTRARKSRPRHAHALTYLLGDVSRHPHHARLALLGALQGHLQSHILLLRRRGHDERAARVRRAAVRGRRRRRAQRGRAGDGGARGEHGGGGV